MDRTLFETIAFAKAQRDAMTKLEGLIPHCSSFKIGKTGETLLDRFNQPDYRGIYSHIDWLFRSSNAHDVDDMESYLINRYINHPKCENKKTGGASNNDTMADDAIEYQVYVVWK